MLGRKKEGIIEACARHRKPNGVGNAGVCQMICRLFDIARRRFRASLPDLINVQKHEVSPIAARLGNTFRRSKPSRSMK